MSIIVAVLVFGLIILIHEFGHFIVAKKCGIGVIEFSIGMGPRLCSFTKGETRYSIKCLPFGGSCMMMGEDENDSDPRAFNNKPVWSRIAVIAAGPVFNFILAFLLALVIVSYVGYDAPVLSGVMEGFPAEEQGLQAGDVLTKVNGRKITVYRDLQMYLMMNPGKELDIEYKRPKEDGSAPERYTAHLVPKFSEEYQANMIGIETSAYRQQTSSFLETLKYSAYEVEYCIRTTIDSGGMLIRGRVSRNDIAGPVRMVSMIDDTVEEIKSAKLILKTLGLRKGGIEVVSCPTCGRTKIDLIGLANQVENMVTEFDHLNVKVAVMGCVVNGPGEAREADLGIAGGIGEGLLIRKGEVIRKVPEDHLLEALRQELLKL